MRRLLVMACLVPSCFSVLFAQTFNNRYSFENYPASNGFSAEQKGDSLLIFSTLADSLYKIGVHILDLDGNELNKIVYYNDSSWNFIGYSNTSDVFATGYVTAGSKRFPEATSRGKIVHWNNELDTVRTKVFHASIGDSLVILQQAKAVEDGFVAVGSTRDGVGTENILLLKTDFDLNEIWRQSYGSTTAPLAGYSVVQTPDGGYLLGGVRKIGQSWDHCVIKTDAGGNQQYLKYYGNEYKSYYAHVANAGDGNYYFGGRLQIGEYDDYSQICKLDQQLDTIWCKEYGSPGPDCRINSLKLLEDGNVIACGMDRAGSPMMGFILKIDPDGNTLWYRKYTQTEENWCFFYDVIQTSDGGYFLAGSLFPEVDLSQDIWGIKLDDMGCLVPGCDTLAGVGTEHSATRFAIYPNPTAQFMNMYIPQGSLARDMSFDMVDLQGQIVKHIAVQEEEVTLMISVEDLPDGIYFVHAYANGMKINTEKVIVQSR